MITKSVSTQNDGISSRNKLGIDPCPAVASLAHTGFFSMRHGIFVLDFPHIALFDNNPVPGREKMWAELKTWLKKNGYRIASEASSGDPGDEGYTIAMVVEHANGMNHPEMAYRIASAWTEMGLQYCVNIIGA